MYMRIRSLVIIAVCAYYTDSNKWSLLYTSPCTLYMYMQNCQLTHQSALTLLMHVHHVHVHCTYSYIIVQNYC